MPSVATPETVEKLKGAWAAAIKNLRVNGQMPYSGAKKKMEIITRKRPRKLGWSSQRPLPRFKAAVDRAVSAKVEKALEGTETIQSDRRHAKVPDEEDEEILWAATDITDMYRSIAPLSVAIRTAFGTTKEIAANMMEDKFVTEIEEHGRVGI